MWNNLSITSISCPDNTELIKILAPKATKKKPNPSPNGSSSLWKSPITNAPMNIQMSLLHAAIVRTSVTGHTVSLASARATGALASGMVEYLVPSGGDLLLVPEYHELKDFVGTAFTGVLGAGMAYLRMLNDGYSWHAHYEDSLTTPLSSNVAQPDFVFVTSTGIAVVESKGTGANLTRALSAAQDGYVRQVYPAFARQLAAGGYPTEGHAFGTSLGTAVTPHVHIQMVSAFEKRLAAPIAATTQATSAVALQVQAIKRLNYLNAARQMGLVKTTRMARDISSTDDNSEEAIAWEDSLDVDTLANGKSDKQLYFGPPLAIFEQDNQIYAARVAMSFGLLRQLKERHYPDVEANHGITELLSKGQNDNYWFVNFPDQVKVVYSPFNIGDDLLS